MKILVTGANGLLGYKLIQLLSTKANITLIATARKKVKDLPQGVGFFELDIANKLNFFPSIHSIPFQVKSWKKVV